MIDLTKLRTECAQCTACALFKNARGTLCAEPTEKFGSVLMLTEPVTEPDIAAGKPLAFKEGALLRQVMRECRVFPERLYITNSVRCLSRLAGEPTYNQQLCCWAWTNKLLTELKPRVIIVVGKPALTMLASQYGFLSKLKKFPMARLAGDMINVARLGRVYPIYDTETIMARRAVLEETKQHMYFLAKALPGWLE